MKKLLPHFLLLVILSCTNSETDKKTKAEQSGIYSTEDLPFIQKADSICQAIDFESIYEQKKDSMITDLDDKKYPVEFKGYSKSISDSVDKFFVNLFFGGKNSGKQTYYYHNGVMIKGITEIFVDDTILVKVYYDGDKMIYPQGEGMADVAERLRNQSASFKTFFLPKK